MVEVLGNQRRRNPSVVRCYARTVVARSGYAQACRAPVASDGVAGAKRGVLVAEALRSITLRVGEVADLIIDLPAQPDEINDATPCRLG